MGFKRLRITLWGFWGLGIRPPSWVWEGAVEGSGSLEDDKLIKGCSGSYP